MLIAITFLLVVLSVTRLAPASSASNIELPTLGDTITGLMSPSQEKVLGQAWLRSFRASVALDHDPVLYEYTQDLLLELASHSDIKEKSLHLVMVDNPTINAFAVPGGVVGVHTGLLTAAKSESQLASVLAHELAHLSQRHFARSVDASKRANVASILGALAGIAIAVGGGGGDAATAAIVTGQAAALDSSLRYSRQHEREADRLGMRSLVEAGYNANGATRMFQEMQNASRLYGSRIPEFLLTHPITQSRISDASQRERQVAREAAEEGRVLKNQVDSIGFQLIKARLYALNEKNKRDAIKHFKFQVSQSERAVAESNEEYLSWQLDAARYGLALSYLNAGDTRKARKAIAPLLKQMPGRIIYSLLDIQIDAEAGDEGSAERRLRDLYSLNPNNYGISMALAELLQKNNKHKDAATVLTRLAEQRPSQSNIWYHLAEAQGKSGDILGLHRSRAEFFLLNGAFNRSIDHLKNAYRIAGDDYQTAATIRQRVNEIIETKRQQDALGFG